MAAAARAAREWKNQKMRQTVRGTIVINRNFDDLEDVVGLTQKNANIAESDLTQSSSSASIHVDIPKKFNTDDRFVTLLQTFDLEQERRSSGSLFTDDEVLKMSDPIVPQALGDQEPGPWMPVKVIIGRERLIFTSKTLSNKIDVIIEHCPLLLTD
jgi:hypothetical protein